MRDKFWNFVFYKFIFVFGVMNVQDIQELLGWCVWFAVLGTLIITEQLCKDRFQFVSSNLCNHTMSPHLYCFSFFPPCPFYSLSSSHTLPLLPFSTCCFFPSAHSCSLCSHTTPSSLLLLLVVRSLVDSSLSPLTPLPPPMPKYSSSWGRCCFAVLVCLWCVPSWAGSMALITSPSSTLRYVFSFFDVLYVCVCVCVCVCVLCIVVCYYVVYL